MKKLDVPELNENLFLGRENEVEKSYIENLNEDSSITVLKNCLKDSVKVIISEFCGLGKSFKIKKMIKEKKKDICSFSIRRNIIKICYL